jgi:hypothetical protein
LDAIQGTLAFAYHLNADNPTWIFLFTYKHAANLLLFGLGHPFWRPEIYIMLYISHYQNHINRSVKVRKFVPIRAIRGQKIRANSRNSWTKKFALIRGQKIRANSRNSWTKKIALICAIRGQKKCA